MKNITAELRAELDCTGERMVPERSDVATFWEHLLRYRFALRYVRGKRVLDIACGEGYGTKALEVGGAASVVGVDISEEACVHAAGKYGIDARVGCATAIPLSPKSVDVVVSYETIEHVADTDAFLRECVRVLKPNGTLIVSTPNKAVYNPNDDPAHNPYHTCEMTEDEFERLVRRHFAKQRMYVQTLQTVPRWSLGSLALPESPWRGWRGYWRLAGIRKSAVEDREAEARSDPVAEILRPERWAEKIAQPYSIWPRRKFGMYQSMYLLCVATCPKRPVG